MEEEDEDLVKKVDKEARVGSKKNNGIFQTQRILSFKEKRPRSSLSLKNNLSLISALAKEKTQL